MEDKETLVISFYRREAAEIGRKIFISNQVFNTLIHHSYDHNIAELYNCIKTSCANAYLAAPPGKKVPECSAVPPAGESGGCRGAGGGPGVGGEGDDRYGHL